MRQDPEESDCIRLAGEINEAGDRLLAALDAERELNLNRRPVTREEIHSTRQAVEELTEEYLRAVRLYTEFFQKRAESA